MKIGIIIPAYNAALTLPSVLARIPSAICRDIDTIWIINDASVDDTQLVSRRLAGQNPKIKVLNHLKNRGYGGAVKTGLQAALGRGVDCVACVHADGQYAPELLPALIQTLHDRGLDILQGSRLSDGSALSGGMPLYKFLAGTALVVLENKTFNLNLTDYHSGYLCYSRNALQEIAFTSLCNGFEFDLEIIASAKAKNLAIGEHPIPTHYGDEVSHLNPIAYGLRVLRVLARYHLGCY